MPKYDGPGSTITTDVWAVGTSAVPLTPTDLNSVLLVTIKAPILNVATVFIGEDSSVTTANGFPLEPGESSPPLQIDGTRSLYAISGSAAQELRALGVK